MQTTELLSQLYVCHEFTIHAAISLTYSRTQSVTLTHLLAHTLTHSLTHSHTHSLTYSPILIHLFYPPGHPLIYPFTFVTVHIDGMAVSSIYGVGTGAVHLTNLGCTGTEMNLLGCSYSRNTGTHTGDVGVRCIVGKQILYSVL